MSLVARNHLLAREKIRISDLQQAKLLREKWGMLTCYDATSAKIFDLAKIPVLLVGDSASQAVFGQKSTIPITMDEMIPMARAVASSCERALVIADMPFGSYQESPELALRNATRFMKEAGVHGVKLEGGAVYQSHVRLLTRSGIPVMAHVGLTPQSEHTLSGYKVQGREEAAKMSILHDAEVLQSGGAFACVVELVPPDVGELLAKRLRIPIVGIGAGPHTDAQVLVWTDMAGFSPPKGTSTTYLSDKVEKPEPRRKVASQAMKRLDSWGSSTKTNHDDWGVTKVEDDWATTKKHPNDDWVTTNKREDDWLGGISDDDCSPAKPVQRVCPQCVKGDCARCLSKIELSRAPKFVKRYANMSDILFEAAKKFYNDVALGKYPASEHCYE